MRTCGEKNNKYVYSKRRDNLVPAITISYAVTRVWNLKNCFKELQIL